MFIQNKYTLLYYKIINNAISKKRVKRRHTHKNYVYFEIHHIIPKSLDGTDDILNLVLLTPREHFLCHYLLCKMVENNSVKWNKLVRAFTFMNSSSSKQNRYMNSRLYEYARKNIGKIMSVSQSGKNNSQFGKIWVSHVGKIHSCKIDKSDLEEYIQNGYIKKRIVNWDIFFNDQEKKKEELKKEVISIDKDISTLMLKREKIITELELVEKNNLYTSVLSEI